MFKLTYDMLTHIPIIDDAHQSIVNQAHVVLNAFKTGAGSSVVHESITFLETYLIEHFNHEEDLQLQVDYPDYERHHKAHESFVEQMTLVILEYQTHGDSIATKKLITDLIFNLFFNHIRTMDRALAQYIQNNS